jgi:hypothetical protein
MKLEPRRQGGQTMKPRAAFWCACCIWVLTVGTMATAFGYNAVHPLSGSVAAQQGNAVNGVAGAAYIGGFATVGALLVWKRPGNPIGWLLSAAGLSEAAGGFGLFLLHFPAARTPANWFGWIWLFGLASMIQGWARLVTDRVVPVFGSGNWLAGSRRVAVLARCARGGTGSDCAGAGSFPGRRDAVAGQAGAGRAHSRSQQVTKASFQGQVRLIFSTRARAWRTSRAGRLSNR